MDEGLTGNDDIVGVGDRCEIDFAGIRGDGQGRVQNTLTSML